MCLKLKRSVCVGKISMDFIDFTSKLPHSTLLKKILLRPLETKVSSLKFFSMYKQSVTIKECSINL